MKSTLLLSIAVTGIIVLAACSKKDMCTCVTTVTATGQAAISTTTTTEMEDGDSCELNVSNGVLGNQQTVVCTVD